MTKEKLGKKYICQQQFAEMAAFGLNLKFVLYLLSQCLTESLGFHNPPLLQAAKRQTVSKPLLFTHIF
jgi:hypothetical protein